ncbi:unnamed protein product [Lampetra fluviatilis]
MEKPGFASGLQPRPPNPRAGIEPDALESLLGFQESWQARSVTLRAEFTQLLSERLNNANRRGVSHSRRLIGIARLDCRLPLPVSSTKLALSPN